jgi:hypothetical protein
MVEERERGICLGSKQIKYSKHYKYERIKEQQFSMTFYTFFAKINIYSKQTTGNSSVSQKISAYLYQIKSTKKTKKKTSN